MSILGVDIGTSGCKAVAFSESGKMLFSSRKDYQLSFPMPIHCELDPSVVWSSVGSVIHCVSSEVKAYDPIQAIGFSSLADSVTLVVTDTCSLSEQLLAGNHGCNAHVFDDKYISHAILVSGGSILRWYRDTIGEVEAMRARKKNKDPYDYIIDLTDDAPSKLFVFPYFAGRGTPKLNPNKKGIVLGLTLDTERSQIVKGLLEGICYELRLNIESLKKAGLEIKHIRAAGGGSKSERWMQLHADILGVPIEVTDVNEAGCRGAAFLAGYGKGIYTSQDEIVDMVKVEKIYEPRSNVSQVYDETYSSYKDLLQRFEKADI